ncbi:MAG: hypothetical protein CME71_02215 [Halobacteriovorax sp.]|nr:hypothetical protein [Halobacteriovorax sp.]
MGRHLSSLISTFLLILVILSPSQSATIDKPHSKEIGFSYVSSDLVLNQQPVQLKDKVRHSELLGLCQLNSSLTLNSLKSFDHFSALHGLQSQYGSLYPSGPSPPRSI